MSDEVKTKRVKMAQGVPLQLGVRMVPTEFQRIKLENVTLDTKVKCLKEEAAKKINVNVDIIELVYAGIPMDDDATLSSCGVKPGVMVHVLKKKDPDPPIPNRTFPHADIQQLVLVFRNLTRSHGYRDALHRLSRPEVMENIIAATPGLSDDPVAIAMLHDPELLYHMSEADTVRRIADLHPCLAEAAQQIVAVVYESSPANPNQPSTSSGYSYSLEALSDDEDMDSSGSDGARDPPAPLSRNHSYSAITSAQLAAAIASATSAEGGSGSGGGSSPATGASSLITNEMFSQAMQHAFATVLPADTLENISRRMAPQLQQMHEMGLLDDVVNIQALQATNGDVQSAINLVFSGVISPN